MPPQLTLDALQVLDAIERKGSFAAAANALYRVPSAITYTVKKLEEDLGVTLFRREGRRALLTPAGRVLLEQGRELLTAAERLVETTRQVDSGWESCLNIAIDSIFDFDIIYPHLADFYALKPDIEINLYEEVLGGAWEAVINNRADLVLGAPEPPAGCAGLRTAPLSAVEWIFCTAPGHPLTRIDRPLTEADIRPYRAVVVRDSSRQLPPLTRRIFSRQAILRVATIQQKIDAQRRGLGVGFLPRQRVQNWLDKAELVALPLEMPPPATQLNLGWKATSRGKALRWFIECLSRDAAGL